MHCNYHKTAMQSNTTFDRISLKERFNPEGSALRRHQHKMMELVIELDRICKKYQIPYFLYGGTLLGAIRHNGFIPWDDDLDICLLRKDYLRLMKVLPKELPDNMVLQNNDTDPNYFYFFAKLRDKNSILEEECPYDRVFKDLKLADLQQVIDTCGKNYPTLKKIRVLFNQLYNFALKNDICNKDYSAYVDIAQYKDRNPNKYDRNKFSKEEVAKLWTNSILM